MDLPRILKLFDASRVSRVDQTLAAGTKGYLNRDSKRKVAGVAVNAPLAKELAEARKTSLFFQGEQAKIDLRILFSVS